MLPTTHLETVDKEWLVLLFCILKGIRVNVGKLVEKEIITYAFKPKERIFFSSPSTCICVRGGVKPLSTKELISNKGALDLAAIRRFAASSSKSTAAQANYCGQQNHPEELDKKMDTLTKMLQHHM